MEKINTHQFTRHHYFNLIRELTYCEFKLRDQSTFLGFIWTLLHPALLFIVLYALFVKWMGGHVPSFPIYLMVGIVQWNYFIRATSGGMQSVISRAVLVDNFVFPRSALVLSAVFTNFVIHLLELCVMIPFLFLFGGSFSLTWLMLPPLIVLETLMILGVSFFLARLAVEYKDIFRIWEIATMAGFFVTPIFYPIEIISPDRQQLLLLNPMARLIMESREFMVYGRMPSFTVLGVLLVVALVLIYLGYSFFKRGEGDFSEKFV